MLLTKLNSAALAVSLLCTPVFAESVSKPASASVAGMNAVTTSDGVVLKANIAGNGVPCLFVHGGPGSGSEVVERLAGKTLESHFKMIYLDQRGSGRSASDAKKNYALDRVVQDMEELRVRLQVKKWVLMSHSFGGIIATAYAKKYPDKVSGMVLLNSILNLPAAMESTATHGYALLPAGKPPMDPAAPLPQRFGMVMGMLNQSGMASKLMYANDATDARVKEAMKGLSGNTDFTATVFQSGAITTYVDDWTPATAALTMPVLVISGKEDHLVGAEHYKAFRFPQQQVVLVPGRHFSMVEHPDEVGKALAGFAARL
ncbi:MAG: alpha/beta hydrolase [Telluria sp.]